MIENFRISPNKYVSDWEKLELKVASNENLWEDAIKIFEDRINGRFLNQIEALSDHCSLDIKIYSGFTTMALDCLLIETLHQFYNGLKETKSKKNLDAFVDFLTSSHNFKEWFKEGETSAKEFYLQIRCGILHQAETKKYSRITIDKKQKEMLVAYEGKWEKGLIIRRDLFHRGLLNEIKEYKRKLIDKVDNPHNYRENFIKKMNMICRIEKD